MTKSKIKRFDTVAMDIKTLCEGIEEFLNSGEVIFFHTFILGRFCILIAIFKTDK